MKLLKDNIYAFSRNGNNAYLIKGKEAVLIDGVEFEFGEEYIFAVKSVIPLDKIKYIVINHCEGNRTGTLNAVLKENPDIIVIASTAGLKFLKRICDREFVGILAKDNMVLDIGGEELRFLLTPNISWPDSMLTIYNGKLFSSDLFGTVDGDIIKYAKEHLYNRENYVKAAIEKLNEFNPNAIYQGSGEPLGENIPTDLHFNGNIKDTVLIIYSSLYGNTEEMSNVVYETICQKNIPAKLINIDKYDAEEIARKIDMCSVLAVGTNTINADAPKKLWNVFAKSDKILNKGKPCMIFGSYGWSGDGAYYIEKHLKLLRYKIFEKPYLTSFKINEKEKAELESFTNRFLEFIK